MIKSRVGNSHGDFQNSSWRWPPWPKTLTDRLALSFFTLGGLFLIWYEQFLILPTYDSELGTNIIVHWIFLVLMAFQIYGNMFMIITTNASTKTIKQPPILLTENWRFCKTCQAKMPPRSHHCVLCDVCIVKRDHHCWFAGYCIGYKNHRYYFVMLIYMTITAIYCNLLNYEFVVKVKGRLGMFNIISFFMPHVGYIIGFYDTYTFLITTLSSLGFVILLMFLWLLQIQLMQIFSGQTRYERKNKIIVSNLGWKHNLVDILGSRWLLVWLFPWVQSFLPGDGFTVSQKDL